MLGRNPFFSPFLYGLTRSYLQIDRMYADAHIKVKLKQKFHDIVRPKTNVMQLINLVNGPKAEYYALLLKIQNVM